MLVSVRLVLHIFGLFWKKGCCWRSWRWWNVNYQSEDLVGHLAILNEVQGVESRYNNIGYKEKTLILIHLLSLLLWTVERKGKWLKVVKEGVHKWYKNVSKINRRSGAGIYGPKYRLSMALGSSPLIFQVKVIPLHKRYPKKWIQSH